MKTTWLLAIGVCLGALGAWVLRDDAAISSAIVDADRGSVASGSNQGLDPRDTGNSGAGNVNGVAISPERLIALAETAPRDAFNEALLLPDAGVRASVLIQVARLWARRSPEDALEQALSLPESLRVLVTSVVAEEWAFVDPAGFLDYADAAGSIDSILAGLTALLATDPERVWEIANAQARLAGSAADELYLSAIRAMAGRDPAATIARFQALATGQRRDLILSSIAEGFADQDLEAALTWVLSLQPLSPDAASAVIGMIAVEDPLRAYEVLRHSGERGISAESLRWVVARAALDSREDPASIATTLVEQYEPAFSGPLVSALLNGWVQEAPDDAMEWLSSNRASVTPESITTMVSDLAFDNVRLAADLLDRVPPEFEFQWLQETAKRYGQFEPDVAVEWVSQFETRADFGQLISQMVLYGNSSFSAALVETTEYDIDTSAINMAANLYVRQDPHAAAEWALRLTDADRSAAAISGVTTGWVLSDPAAAQQWALQLPRGETRDTVIDTFLWQGAGSPLDLESLIESYSSEAVADQSISSYLERAVRNRGGYDDTGSQRVEQLVELITDSELRREVEEILAEAR